MWNFHDRLDCYWRRMVLLLSDLRRNELFSGSNRGMALICLAPDQYIGLYIAPLLYLLCYASPCEAAYLPHAGFRQ
jgi:hypothetical protein